MSNQKLKKLSHKIDFKGLEKMRVYIKVYPCFLYYLIIGLFIKKP